MFSLFFFSSALFLIDKKQITFMTIYIFKYLFPEGYNNKRMIRKGSINQLRNKQFILKNKWTFTFQAVHNFPNIQGIHRVYWMNETLQPWIHPHGRSIKFNSAIWDLCKTTFEILFKSFFNLFLSSLIDSMFKYQILFLSWDYTYSKSSKAL